LNKLSTDKVKVKGAFGRDRAASQRAMSMLAQRVKRIILGFNVAPKPRLAPVAESEERLKSKCYSIIYELLDEVKKAMYRLARQKGLSKSTSRPRPKFGRHFRRPRRSVLSQAVR